MTYCLGIATRAGLVLASDSRTNAGYDQVNVSRKMHTFEQSGERVFALLTSGSLSCAQSVVTLLQRDFDRGLGLAQSASLYDAARVVGSTAEWNVAMRRVFTKLGFAEEGVMRGFMPRADGGRDDYVLYARLRDCS